MLTIPFLNIPAAVLLTLLLLVLARRADGRRPAAPSRASLTARFLVGAVVPALLTPPLVGLALALGARSVKSPPGAEFFGLGLLLMLISIGPLLYLAVLLSNDRLVRLPLVRRRRHAFLIGMVAPAALFLVNLIATEFCARALFNAMT